MVHDEMKSSCKTSVIIPVYNVQDYLPACLDSVLAQTQEDIEVILVDDGSTDGSLEIELAYAARDPRVRVIQQPNLRQGTARNRGLAEARGEYVYFMDSDDLIVPEHFETCYLVCKKHNLEFVTFETFEFINDPNVECPDSFRELNDRRGKVTQDVVDGPMFWARYFPGHMIPFVCWLEYFDRTFLIENDLRFVEGIYFEDNDWIARVFMAAKRIKFLPLRLHRYRLRPGSNVRSGFTTVLADSCFDVHAVLCSLARSEQDPARLRIIRDISDVKDCRFKEFATLEPTESLRAMTSAFVQLLLDECAQDDLPDIVRSMHFSTVVSLAEGVSAWSHPPVVLTKELAKRLLNFNVPELGTASRVGVYGTGKACEGFLWLFDTKACTYFFLGTDVDPGQKYRGKRVVSIRDAHVLDLDAVIITSAKYAEEMKSNVARYLGEDTPVYVVPSRIQLLAKKQVACQIGHPRLFAATRRIEKTVKKLMGKAAN